MVLFSALESIFKREESNMENGKKDGLSRRGFLKAAGAIGTVAIAQKAMAQMPTLVAANPLVGTIDMHVH
jgi:hypothetical protein